MKQTEAVIATTSVDRQGEQITREALEHLAASIGRAFVPIGVEHDPRRAPIGRLASAYVRDRDDGESEVVAVMETFDDDDAIEQEDCGRELVIQDRGKGVAISYDWTHRHPVDQEDIAGIAAILETESTYEGKKAAEPISIITFMAGTIAGGLAAGFLGEIGKDAWSVLKAKLLRIFARTDLRRGEQLLKISFLLQQKDRSVEIVVIATNPTADDIDGLLRNSLSPVEDVLPTYLDQVPDLRRLTFEYKGGTSVPMFGVSKDCRPWLALPQVPERSESVAGAPIRFSLFRDSETSFCQSLDDNLIEYAALPSMPGVLMSSGSSIEVFQTLATSGAIAAVLVAWIKARASRKIIITTRDNEVIHLEGFSLTEIQKLLPRVRQAMIIDTQRSEVTDVVPKE